MPPKVPTIKDEKRAERKERKREKKRKAKEEKAAAAPAPAEKKRKKNPPKLLRRDWAAMKASLVYDERGFGRTPDGAWAYFLAVRPASEKALPAGHAAERS
ncbi:hypothetical protein NA56DRAFT_711727 [Hyaloscypha hepaticicola]|uniref:Uncharacterized protein n=1 Tax=Hyaloscypha hepaticicola TaxID=2082293 RepID=A0A2J6PI66_9HELO|nr:hypothetical protein NA56DRAFT_711727 [Hyaloscypha hepaticicola]